MAIPLQPSRFNFWPFPVTPESLDPNFPNPDMNLVHSVYGEKDQILFPKSETFYLTILRNPAYQWASIYSYFQIGRALGLDNKPTTMRKFIEIYPSVNETVKRKIMLPQNPNFIDFGFRDKKFDTFIEIHESILKVEEIFDLVMISELWEESLLILKNKLCMDFDDIVVFDANVRAEKTNKLSNELKEIIKAFNIADTMMYDYFYHKLKNEAANLDPIDFVRLRQRKAFWENVCIGGREIKTAYASKTYLGYKLKDGIPEKHKSKCEGMIRSEIEFVKLYRQVN